ncbi:MAG: thiamine pyrophosphate-binding protein [bacterium]
MRLSDYVIDFIAKQNVKHVFMVSGGGGMFLIDSLGRREDIKYICNHHEQATIMAAEGYQRITENLGVTLTTTGPAATNTLTGVLCAWNDSIPLMVISGQANSKFLIEDTGLRQRGVHEVDIVKMIESVTKYAVTVKDEKTIRYHLEKAAYLAKNGRPGPVWLDIPIDIQSKNIEVEELKGFYPEKEVDNTEISELKQIKELLNQAKRPVIIAGHGIKLSGMKDKFIKFIEKYNIPVVTTKIAFDLIHDSHPLLAGRFGTYGQRAGNFAVQNADLVISMGSRLCFSSVGYESNLFAREAKKVVINLDEAYFKYPTINVDLPVKANLKNFIPALNTELEVNFNGDYSKWIDKCHHWREKYPVVTAELKNQKDYVNSYYFFEVLSELMSKDDSVITDQGATFYSYTTAFKLKEGQKAFTNGGFSPMGYGLPAAIGASLAKDIGQTVCVHGDGGLQLNIQELQTMVHYHLPLKLFVFNNNGYLSIKHTQNAYFDGFLVGSDPSSGLSCPDTIKIANAYGLQNLQIFNHDDLREKIKQALELDGPAVIEVMLDPLQAFTPRVASVRKPDGRMVSSPLEDMSPLLPREEFYQEMIVEPVKEIENNA